MTTINALARQLASEYNIGTHTAAVDVVRVHVDQIAADPALWNQDTDTLTDAGVELVTGAVAESYAGGYHATAAQQLLEDIAEDAAAIAAAEQTIKNRTATRDEKIRAALKTELSRDSIAAAARLQRSRLYQIRDGRR